VNDSALAREQHALDRQWTSTTPRRERHPIEPIDNTESTGDGATDLGNVNDSALAREQHALDRQWTSTTPRRERHPIEPKEPIDNSQDGGDAGAIHLGMLNENALRLLQIMGRRGNWSSEVLLERSALPFSEFQHALLLLELEGRVRRRCGDIDPV
jgi:hypothetical protein